MTRRWVVLLNEMVDKQRAEMTPTQIKEWRDYFWKISLLLFPGGFIADLVKGEQRASSSVSWQISLDCCVH